MRAFCPACPLCVCARPTAELRLTRAAVSMCRTLDLHRQGLQPGPPSSGAGAGSRPAGSRGGEKGDNDKGEARLLFTSPAARLQQTSWALTPELHASRLRALETGRRDAALAWRSRWRHLV